MRIFKSIFRKFSQRTNQIEVTAGVEPRHIRDFR